MNLFYLIAATCFIIGLKRLSHPKTARSGNIIAAVGMLIAIVATLVSSDILDLRLIAIGLIIGSTIGALFAARVQMTQMPQMVAIFNGFGGGASALVASSEFFTTTNSPFLIVCISVFIGTLTFSGSFIAFGKLQGFISGKPIVFKGQQFFNALAFGGIIILLSINNLGTLDSQSIFYAVLALSFLLGMGLVIPIGGADMPVVISMLNSYSGWAAAGIGFTLENTALIITGALVGSSGAILSYIMCKGMNRSFFNVILGGFGATEQSSANKEKEQKPVKSGNAEDAAFLMKNASSVIIVPGYGMAVAQAQHSLKEMVDALKKNGIKGTNISAAGGPCLAKGLANKAHTSVVFANTDIKIVKKALKILTTNGTSKKNIYLLHCNTDYPTNYTDVNLRAMLTMRNKFKIKVGYSDHTLGIEVPIAACAMGATVIEKHFTLDRTLSQCHRWDRRPRRR